MQRWRGSLHDLLRDHHFLDAFEARQLEHGVQQNAFHDRTQAPRPGFPFDRLAGNGAQCLLGKAEVDALHLKQPMVLFNQRVLRLDQDTLERGLVEVFEGGEHWQAPHELREQAIFQKVLRLSVVASAMVKGTSRVRASVCASSVLPDPVGPISRMFDLASSTSSCLVWWWRRL